MNKKVIVTGGGSGLGKHMARHLAERGCDLAVSYARSKAQAESLAAEISALGRKCYAIHADFTQPDAMSRFFDEATHRLGGLDILVNNAADTSSSLEVFDLDNNSLDRIYAVNFRSCVIGMREAGRYMAARGTAGSIVNISSIHSRTVWPNDAAYGALKAGLERIVRSFALTLAPYGIRVNCLAPGAFRNLSREETNAAGASMEDYDFREKFARTKIPLGRLGEAAELAEAVLFFSSEHASYITGQTLLIDGGISLPCMPEGRPHPDEDKRGWAYVEKRTFNRGEEQP